MLDSLRALSQEQQVCCPVSSAWYAYTHERNGQAVDEDFRQIPELLSACRRGDLNTSLVTEIVQLARAPVLGSHEPFPGPMCSPFRRANTHAIRTGNYTFTEKSDGIRLIIVSLRVESFPRWEILGGENGTGLVADLRDVVALEEGRHRLALGLESDTQVTFLDDRQYRLSRVTDDASDVRFFLLPVTDGDCIQEDKRWQVQRELHPRHFSYSFDRAMEMVYLLFEEHSIDTLECFVVDGELMVCEPYNNAELQPHLLLGLFDLYCYHRVGECESHILARQPMSVRSRLLQREVIDAIESEKSSPPRYSIQWFAKEMWSVDQMGECLKQLEYNKERKRYLFRGRYGRTLNDGLIFTPDSFDLICGASRTQFKWKWRASLSVDWLLTASATHEDTYEAALYFYKRNYGHRKDSVGHWKLRRPMRLLNPHRYDIPVGCPVVAECTFSDERRSWVIDRIRNDRTGANSIVTAISVYESLAENLTLVELLGLLGIEDTSVVACARSLDAAYTQPRERAEAVELIARPTAKLTLRATHSSDENVRKLSLYWCTNKGNSEFKNVIPCPLCLIRDCTGLGLPAVSSSDERSLLEDHLMIKLGNAGGCYAWSDFTLDVFFDGTVGRWEVVRCHPCGLNRECDFENVLAHLDWVIRAGGGGVARSHITSDHKDPPAAAPAIRLARTLRTNTHYAQKAILLSSVSRNDRSHLRQFNNWVKSFSISCACRTCKRPGMPFRVLDLCCGRGGDLPKWRAAQPDLVFMTDASPECVAEAAGRYSTTLGMSLKVVPTKVAARQADSGFRAIFEVHDAFDTNSHLAEALQAVAGRSTTSNGDSMVTGAFQLASCQFSLHYGCSTRENLEYFLRAVAGALETGGRFIGTTVDADVVMQRLRKGGGECGNAVYHIRFPLDAPENARVWDGQTVSHFGAWYFASVENVVEDLPEFLVPWKEVVDLCAAHGLVLREVKGLLDYYEENKGTPEGKELMEKMGTKRSHDSVASLQLSEEEKEAASVYCVFAFEKV